MCNLRCDVCGRIFTGGDGGWAEGTKCPYSTECNGAMRALDTRIRSAPTGDLVIGGPPIFRSTDSATRKRMPVTEGVLKYFPDAMMCVAYISKVGNDKHNPGEPLHWAKEKSTDESDCEVRHMLDYLRNIPPDTGLEALGRLGHLASKAWRALAHLQRECDAEVAAYEAQQASAADRLAEHIRGTLQSSAAKPAK